MQEVPKALSSLKYFFEDSPEYHVICAGLLLGIALHGGTSFPVGKVEFLKLYPLSFKEFLMAMGKERYVELKAKSLKTYREKYSSIMYFYWLLFHPTSAQRSKIVKLRTRWNLSGFFCFVLKSFDNTNIHNLKKWSFYCWQIA